MDRWTKLILVAVAGGLWANVAVSVFHPTIALADDISTLASYLSSIKSDISSIRSDVSSIERDVSTIMSNM